MAITRVPRLGGAVELAHSTPSAPEVEIRKTDSRLVGLLAVSGEVALLGGAEKLIHLVGPTLWPAAVTVLESKKRKCSAQPPSRKVR